MGWLIALGIVILLAILPLGITARYNANGLSWKWVVGPVRFSLDSEKDDQSEKRTKKIKASLGKKEEKEEKGGILSEFLPTLREQLDFLNALRQKVRVKYLEMKLTLAGEDPCDLAINYGRAQGVLHSLMPLLEECLIIKKRDIQIHCDFEASETTFFACAEVRITLARLVALVWRYANRYGKENQTKEKSRKGGASK